MSIEPEKPQALPDEDPHTQEMVQMEALWQMMPDEHRVSLALKFVDSVMAGAYRPYFLHLAAQKWALQTTEFDNAFSTTEPTVLM